MAAVYLACSSTPFALVCMQCKSCKRQNCVTLPQVPRFPIAILPPWGAGWRLQLLIFELALQLLGLAQLAYRLVEVVLVDGVSVGLDGE
jgi:hypothetical protein